VDILVGSSPCQSFSYAGLGKGLEDSDGLALLEFIINLLSKDNLYPIEFDLINMVDYDIPQKRQRLFILGSLKSINLRNLFPIPKLYRKQILQNVLMNVPDTKGATYLKIKEKLFQKIPEGGYWINLPLEDQKNYLGKMVNSRCGKKGILRCLSMSEPSAVLLCSPFQKQTERCHPFEERFLTIREYARIQTFRNDYQFYGSVASQDRQIGNAIPVLFSYQLGLHLSRELSLSDT
jgi:DNA (cytosine-5)-methyltransferase 1